jgi:hypothetical protein
MIITNLMERERFGYSKELQNYGKERENITKMYFKK